MIPKVKRLTDSKTVQACRKEWCEVCGQRSYGEPHHIITRGAGGPDHRYNLIQLCWVCHYGKVPAAELPKEILFGFVAKREGVTVAIIEETLNRIRR